MAIVGFSAGPKRHNQTAPRILSAYAAYDHLAALGPIVRAPDSDHRIFAPRNPCEPEFGRTKPKRYILDKFPCPSCAGLHVGHRRGPSPPHYYTSGNAH